MPTLGNAEALRAYKDESLSKTRLELEKALRRLVNRNPRVVDQSSKINATSVAKEACVDRSTLYRYHKQILNDIQRLNDTTPRAKLKEKRSELAQVKGKAKEYHELLEAAQDDKVALVRENYRLVQRVVELEALLIIRDETILELQEKLYQDSMITPLRS